MDQFTLAELKAQNEAEQKGEPIKLEDNGISENDGGISEEIETDASAEISEKSTESAEDEEDFSWYGEDDQAGEAEQSKHVPLSAHIAERKKLQGRIQDKDDEISKLKEMLKSIQTGGQSQDQVVKVPMPDDYDDYDSYVLALTQYQDSALKKAQHELILRQEREKHEKAIESSVNEHYSRAAILIEKTRNLDESKRITDDDYRTADANVRSVFNNIMPGYGDKIADEIIHRLGAGSERVMYLLGKNRRELEAAESLLRNDHSGLSLAIHLGRLVEKVTGTAKKIQSGAPKPAPKVLNADKSVSDINLAELKKQYADADRKGDAQRRWDIRKKAKEAGIDVNNW